MTRHSIHPNASVRIGAPETGAGFVLIPLSFCGVLAEERPNLPASSRCPCDSTFTAKWWVSRIMPIVFEVFSTATTTIGGAEEGCGGPIAGEDEREAGRG